MYRKTPGEQTSYRSPKGTEKHIDYILIKRRHLRYSKDAAANDMIHMGREAAETDQKQNVIETAAGTTKAEVQKQNEIENSRLDE